MHSQLFMTLHFLLWLSSHPFYAYFSLLLTPSLTQSLSSSLLPSLLTAHTAWPSPLSHSFHITHHLLLLPPPTSVSHTFLCWCLHTSGDINSNTGPPSRPSPFPIITSISVVPFKSHTWPILSLLLFSCSFWITCSISKSITTTPWLLHLPLPPSPGPKGLFL